MSPSILEAAFDRRPPAAAMLGGMGALACASKLLGDLASEGERQIVMRGLPNNPTTEMNLALWALAQVVQADPPTAALCPAHPARAVERCLPQWQPAPSPATQSGAVPGSVWAPQCQRARHGRAALVGRSDIPVRRARELPPAP